MQKHAYLILAHGEPQMLQTLVSLLDSQYNDIYIHWDAKSGPIPDTSVKDSVLRFIERRVKVYWGDYSVVEAEYALFAEARTNGNYQYYHLISGADLPIKRQIDIHKECEEHPGIEYIGFANAPETEIKWRTDHVFLFPHAFKSHNAIVRLFRKAFNISQDVLRLKRQKETVKKGAQWVSVTQDFVDYLLLQKEYVHTAFKRTFCPDELFIQTVCWNSPFRDKTYSLCDEFSGCKRFIKWENGDLKPIAADDVNEMLSSDRWFARKFNPQDREIMNSIISYLK